MANKIINTIRKAVRREPEVTRFRVRTQRATEFFRFMLDRWGLVWSETIVSVPDEGRFHIYNVLDVPIEKRDTLDFVINFFDRTPLK